MTTVYQVDEELEPGLRYTEEFSRIVRSFPVGDYMLWKEGIEEPISGLNVLYFRQRLGAIAVPSAGIGGVETLPPFRRQGYARMLLTRAIESIARRVPIVYISEAIEGLYEKHGFVNCLSEAYLEIQIRNVERLAGSTTDHVRSLNLAHLPATLPAMVGLYNKAHAMRPWTHERQSGWNRLHETQTWQVGSEAIVAERGGRLVGYAILREEPFGWTQSPFVAHELTARDVKAAHALLVEVAARCWKLRLPSFRVREPLDSAVGRAAKQLGCRVHQTYPPSGGMMGAILDRRQLLSLLEPELRRRAAGIDLGTEQAAAFDALCRGEALPDNGVLLRLLVGHWSPGDAAAFSNAGTPGTEVPVPFERVFEAWFPGGGTRQLPLPYSHVLDRY
jgi:GNAT superfamily N-acetyltransferase